jgi:nicotinamide-nucleotide amidase
MTKTPLESSVGELLRQRGLRLAIAESCTGGLLGHRVTNVPGSSTYYQGSVTAYAYEAKVRLLGVRWETLEYHGAVSQETVLEMAKGVRELLAADVGLSISGIAGPGGGTREKPVGLVWIGISTEGSQQAWQFNLQGDRLAIKEQSAEQALMLLVDFLQQAEKRRQADKVEVTARFDLSGLPQPLSFKWNDRQYNISAVGRHWEDTQGKHTLVMDSTDRVHELLFVPAEGSWYLLKRSQEIRSA